MTRLPLGTEVRIDGGSLFQIANGVSQHVTSVVGTLWITQTDEPRDILLGPGESAAFTNPANVIIGAINGPAIVRTEEVNEYAMAA